MNGRATAKQPSGHAHLINCNHMKMQTILIKRRGELSGGKVQCCCEIIEKKHGYLNKLSSRMRLGANRIDTNTHIHSHTHTPTHRSTLTYKQTDK